MFLIRLKMGAARVEFMNIFDLSSISKLSGSLDFGIALEKPSSLFSSSPVDCDCTSSRLSTDLCDGLFFSGYRNWSSLSGDKYFLFWSSVVPVVPQITSGAISE